MELAADIKPGGILKFAGVATLVAFLLLIGFSSLKESKTYDNKSCLNDPKNIQEYGTIGVRRHCSDIDPANGYMPGFAFAALFALPAIPLTINILCDGDTA